MTGNKLKPLRHSTEGGYVRGDETRQRIIEAAFEVFGERGFDAATTRQIAAYAGVNTPALQYYFENKEGLYVACAAWLADENLPYFQPLLEQIQSQVKQTPAQQCIELFCQLIEVMLDRIFATQYSPNKQLFLARIQQGQGPEAAFNVIRTRLGKSLNRAGAKLIALISDSSPDDEKTQLRSLALFGQIIMFHVMHRTVLDQLQWKRIDASKVIALKSVAREHCVILLNSWRA